MTYRITSELTISGDSEKCKALYLNIVDHFGQIDFNNIVPMPAAIRNATDYFIKEPWMMRHWGPAMYLNAVCLIDALIHGKMTFLQIWGTTLICFGFKKHAKKEPRI